MKHVIVLTYGFLITLCCNTIVALQAPCYKDSSDSGIKMIGSFTDKDIRDSVILSRLYDKVHSCYTKKDKLCMNLMSNITKLIDENKNILGLKFQKGEGFKGSYPLVAFADFVDNVSRWWGVHDRLGGYESAFWSLFDNDTDNSRRVEALKVFIKSNNVYFIRKTLEKQTDIVGNSSLVQELILCCHGKRSVLEPTTTCDFLRRMIANIMRPSYSVPEDEPSVFCKRSLAAQLDAMNIARLLITFKADLSGVGTFPAGAFTAHTEDCVSCLFIYSRFMDSQKKTP